MRILGLYGLLVLVILHQDFWLWDRGTIVFGLPIGLSYHIALCVCSSIIFLVLTRSHFETFRGGDQS